MDDQHLSRFLSILAECPVPVLPENFNQLVHARIRTRSASACQSDWCEKMWIFAKLRWEPAVLLVAVMIGLVLGRLVPGADSDSFGRAKAPGTVTGEVIDLACYFSDGARGPDHAACARRCIESGLPVGIKTTNGETFLLCGDVAPEREQFAGAGDGLVALNEELAPYAAQTVTVRGRIVRKEGLRVIESVRIVTD